MTTGVLVAPGGPGGPGRIRTVPVFLHRTDFYDAVVGGLLVIFLVFFFVGERITKLPIPIRVEDFIFLLLVPFGYRYLARAKTKLFYWIAAYFAINAIPYTAALMAGEYTLSVYPIIMMKELQYFYIAFLVTQNRTWWVLGTVDVLALVIIAYGVRSILTANITYYGIGTFGNTLAPSLAGALFLFSSIWLHIRSKLLPSRMLQRFALVVVMAGAVCAIATVSRSSIAALVVYVATYLLLANLLAFPAFLTAIGLSPIAIQAAALSLGAGYGLIATQIIGRAQAVGISAADRAGKWQNYLSSFAPTDYVFGRGKGYPNAIDGGFGLGVDSQYVRIIMEEGVVGLIIMAAILLTMLHTIRKRGGEYQHAWAVVMAMLVMAVPLEALQVSKSGGFFWLVMFYLLSCQRQPAKAAA